MPTARQQRRRKAESAAENGLASSKPVAGNEAAAERRGRPPKAARPASGKRRGRSPGSKNKRRRGAAASSGSGSETDAEADALPDYMSDSDGAAEHAAAADSDVDSQFEEQLAAAAASNSDADADADGGGDPEPSAMDEGTADGEELQEDEDDDDDEDGEDEEEDDEEEEEEYVAKPKRVRKPDKRRGRRRRGPRKPPLADADIYAPSESEPVVSDADDGEAVDGPSAGAAASDAAAGEATAAASQLVPTELPLSETVLERAGNYAPTSISTEAFGDAVAAYNVLRAFSWQLRLSPFPLADWCAALASPQPTPLADEAHIALIRLLAQDESKSMRAERELDLELLDSVTWPDYVWEWLRYMGDPLAKHQFTARPADSAAAAAAAAASAAEAQVGAAFLADSSTAAPDGQAQQQQEQQSQESQQQLRLLLRGHFPRRPGRGSRAEYYQLPVAVKAAIAARLTSDMLEVLSVRSEIDRREAAGQFVAGRGGQGGANPMRTLEERAERQKLIASSDDADDGNLDTCMLCGLGGNLLCCDGCPAAYHMRCIGEGAKSIPDGEWLCAECSLGGRGEAAGLRVPTLGRNQARQPHWAAYNLLFHSALPPFDGEGAATHEQPAKVPMRGAAGSQAVGEVRQLRRSCRRGAERPPPSSLPTPEPLPLPELQAAAGAEGYNNRYRNGWGASVAAHRAAVEEARRNKRGTGPTVSQMAAPLPLSRFTWPVTPGRGGGRAAVRCGRCQPCLRPSMHKACLNPIAAQPTGAVASDNPNPWLSPLCNYLLKLERDLFGLLDGPWGVPDNTAHRRNWATSVRRAQDARQLAVAAVQLVAALRRTVLPLNWGRLPAQPAPEPPPLPPGLFNVSAIAMSAAQLPRPAALPPAKATPTPVHAAAAPPGTTPQPQPQPPPPPQQPQAKRGPGRPRKGAAAPAADLEGTPPASRAASAAGGSGAATPASSGGEGGGGGGSGRPQPKAVKQLSSTRQVVVPAETRTTRASAAKAVNYADLEASDSDDEAANGRRSGAMSRSGSFSGAAAGKDVWDDSTVTLDEFTSIPVVVRRTAWQRAQGFYRLPRAATRKAARQGGKLRIPGIKYAAKDLVMTPAMSWVARTESAVTAPQLARCLRALDAAIQWDQLRAPGGASMESQWRGCELRMRRPSSHPVGGFEYLVFPKSQLPQTPSGNLTPMPSFRPAPQPLPQPLPAAATAAPVLDLGQLRAALGSKLWDSPAASAGAAPVAASPAVAGGSPALGEGAMTAAAATDSIPAAAAVAGAADTVPAGGFMAAMAAALSEPAASDAAAPAAAPDAPLSSPGILLPCPMEVDEPPQQQQAAGQATEAADTQPDGAVAPGAAVDAVRAEHPSVGAPQPSGSSQSAGAAGSEGDWRPLAVELQPQPPAVTPPPKAAAAAAAAPHPEAAGAEADAGQVTAAKSSTAAATAAGAAETAAAAAPVSAAEESAVIPQAVDPRPPAALTANGIALAVRPGLGGPEETGADADAVQAKTATAQQRAPGASAAVKSELDASAKAATARAANGLARSRSGSPDATAPSAGAEMAASDKGRIPSGSPAPAAAPAEVAAACEFRTLSGSPGAAAAPPAAAGTPAKLGSRTPSGGPGAAGTPPTVAAAGRRGRLTGPSRLGGLNAPLPSSVPSRLGPAKAGAPCSAAKAGATSGLPQADGLPMASGTSVPAPSPAAAAAAAAAAQAAAAGRQPTGQQAALAQQLQGRLGLPQHLAAPLPAPAALQSAGAPGVPVQQLAAPAGSMQPFSPSAVMPMQAPAMGHWVHERHLPLWLVRNFEERLRREAAMQVARAAQARAAAAREAQRQAELAEHQAVLQARQTARQMAKEAAEAAAKAAADSCAICGGEYGTDPEKDTLWVACDGCNRWHHGACINVTEEDQMDEKKWECSACAARRAEKRRAAMDRARQKRGGRGTPADSGVKRAAEDGAPKKARKKGKSSKLQDGALDLVCICREVDDSVRLLVACDQCGLWCHPECVGADPQEVTKEGVPFSCPTCERRSRRRAAQEADRTAAAYEAELAAAAEKEKRAAEAAMREARRADREDAAYADTEARKHGAADWRDAAANVLQALMAWPAAAAFCEPVDPGLAEYHKVIERPMDLGTIAANLQGGGYAAPQRLLRDVRQVWDNCRTFNYEGDDFWRAGAKSEAKFGKLWAAAGLPTEFSAPAELPVVPGAPISAATEPPPRIKVKLPGTAAPAAKSGGLKIKLHLGGSRSAGPTSDAEAQRLATAAKVLKKFLRRPCAEPFAEPVPADVPGYHDVIEHPMDLGSVLANLQDGAYSSLAEAAADMQLVWANCTAFNEDGSDMSNAGVAAEEDLAALFVAAGLPTPADALSKRGKGGKAKGKKGADAHTAEDHEAADMLAALGRPREQPVSESDSAPAARRGRKRRHDDSTAALTSDDGAAAVSPTKRQRGAGGSVGAREGGRPAEKDAAASLPDGPPATAADEPMSAAQAAAARKAVLAVAGSAEGGIFAHPVGPEAPGYRREIRRPMDLGTIADKLQRGAYATPGEVWSDVELVWANCRRYNGEGSPLDLQAQSAAAAMARRWCKARLPLPQADTGGAAHAEGGGAPAAAGRRGRGRTSAPETAAAEGEVPGPASPQQQQQQQQQRQGRRGRSSAAADTAAAAAAAAAAAQGAEQEAEREAGREAAEQQNLPRRSPAAAKSPAGRSAADGKSTGKAAKGTPDADTSRAAALGLRVKRQRTSDAAAALTAAPAAADAAAGDAAAQPAVAGTGQPPAAGGASRRKSGKGRSRNSRGDNDAASRDAHRDSAPQAVEEAAAEQELQPKRRSGRH